MAKRYARYVAESTTGLSSAGIGSGPVVASKTFYDGSANGVQL